MTTSINKEKRALLYSGGLDSYCTYHLLKSDGVSFDTINFDLRTRYAKQEYAAITGQDVDIDKYVTLDLAWLEHSNAHLPYRNLMLAAYVASMGYNEILLGGTQDDRSSDMISSGFESMSRVLSDLESRTVSVYAPYGYMTKFAMIEKFMRLDSESKQQAKLRTTFSCYRPLDTANDNHCMECPACLRRAIYMIFFGAMDPTTRFKNRLLLIWEYRRVVVNGSGYTSARIRMTHEVLERMMDEYEIEVASQLFTYSVDLDGTLCEEKLPYKEGYYEKAVPIHRTIDRVNRAYKQGHKVVIYTSRYESDREITELWLKEHGVQYNRLDMDKPKYDVWVDDRSVPIPDFIGSEGE